MLIGDSLIHQYRFEKNYYIVGKATRIWNSKEKYTDQIRWERILMKIK